ncbi:MAG: damage-control phosphatase ARMT1 family protein [Bacteroidota bacterium]
MENNMTETPTQRPPFINGEDPHSFAAFTISKRLPHILAMIVKDNMLTEEQAALLEILKEEVLSGVVMPIHTLQPVEQAFWQAFFQEYTGVSYYQAPFCQVEAYFYRRIMGVIQFFEAGYRDPFLKQKTQNLSDIVPFLEQTLLELHSQPNAFDDGYFKQLLKINLWGNTADLSQLAANQKVEITEENLVVDKSPLLLAYLHSVESLERIDIIVDNAGLELVTDLLLSDYLLRTGKARQIVFHLKYHPTFVSDATIPDFLAHISYFAESASIALNELGERINSHLSSQQFLLKDHLFWNSPLHFTQFPPDLSQYLSQSSLLIFKGDANYRRLFEDRHWPIDQPSESLLSYLSVPSLLLRILKSAMVVGMSTEKGQQVAALDAHWRTNAKFGLIDFCESADDL